MEVMPIIEITENNLVKMMPAVLNAIKMSSFIAVDCELSGLGNRKNLSFPEMDVRYKLSSDVARSHAIISLGLSCFSCRSMSRVSTTDSEGEEVSSISSHAYLVQTFNFLTLCSDNYMVECDALKFLLRHGFDFNKQYREGIKYYRGCDKEFPKKSASGIRDIFSSIIVHEKPLVLHNGMVDLLFMYQSFYADLPRKAETFAADLKEMFPSGIYDTKYLAEYKERLPATYLEYLYKKMQLRNEKKKNLSDWYVVVNFPPYPPTLEGIEWVPYRQICSYRPSKHDHGDVELCESYAFHGWCSKENECTKSHHMDHIVTTLQTPALKKRGGSKRSGPLNYPIANIVNAANKKHWVEVPRQEKDRKQIESSVEENVLGKLVKQEPGVESDEEGVQCIDDKGHEDLEAGSDEERNEQTLDGKEMKSCEDSGTKEGGNGDRNETHVHGRTHHNKGDDSEVVDLESDEKDPKNDDPEVVAVIIDSVEKRKCQEELENSSTVSPAKRIKEEPQNSDKSGDSDKEKITSDDTSVEWNPLDENGDNNNDNPNASPDRRTIGGHRAGYDAYMTGFIFACFLAHSRQINKKPQQFSPATLGLQDEVNKIYLIGKNSPFLIRSSAFSKPSLSHTTKMQYLKGKSVPV